MWHKYFTPPNVASLMVNLIKDEKQKTAIDICVGSWNLLREVSNRWNYVELHGVDIEPSSQDNALKGACFTCIDGRSYAIECLKNNERHSLVLANPPFGKEKICNYAKYSALPGYELISKKALGRIETTMLLANLCLLEKEGILVAIIPRTLIDGDWAVTLRKFIASHYHLESIIHLPSNIFSRDISTSIIVVRNSQKLSNKTHTTEYCLRFKDEVFQSYNWSMIDLEKIIEGIWSIKIHDSIQQSEFEIYRGKICSSNLKSNGKNPVIHSIDLKSMNSTSWKPSCISKSQYLIDIKRGDIFMVRVGRNCGQVARATFNFQSSVSDCVYVIRHNSLEKMEDLWKYLNSVVSKQSLGELKRGITSKYITKDVLKNHLNNFLMTQLSQLQSVR